MHSSVQRATCKAKKRGEHKPILLQSWSLRREKSILSIIVHMQVVAKCVCGSKWSIYGCYLHFSILISQPFLWIFVPLNDNFIAAGFLKENRKTGIHVFPELMQSCFGALRSTRAFLVHGELRQHRFMQSIPPAIGCVRPLGHFHHAEQPAAHAFKVE